VTPGRAALGRTLCWAYWATGLLLAGPILAVTLEPLTGSGFWGRFWVGAGLAVVLISVQARFGRRLADRVYAEFAAVAREWGMLSGRITETTEEQR
jgi:hypothetical protein